MKKTHSQSYTLTKRELTFLKEMKEKGYSSSWLVRQGLNLLQAQMNPQTSEDAQQHPLNSQDNRNIGE